MCNLPYHTLRMNATRKAAYGATTPIDLSDFIAPSAYSERTKCRVEYGREVMKVEYAPYLIRPVATLRLATCDGIDYRYKSTDRSALNALFDGRGEADDVLIVRNGLLTDSSICNIALWNGRQWLTPAHPLLCGTMRAYLLDSRIIFPADIRVEHLPAFSRLRLFNAMIDFGQVEIGVEDCL